MWEATPQTPPSLMQLEIVQDVSDQYGNPSSYIWDEKINFHLQIKQLSILYSFKNWLHIIIKRKDMLLFQDVEKIDIQMEKKISFKCLFSSLEF